MRKIILLIIALALCVSSYSQSMIGYTPSEVKKEHWLTANNPYDGYVEDGSYYIFIQLDFCAVIYYFENKYSSCFLCCIVPNNQVCVNMFVQKYNSEYVINSSKSWTAYIGTVVCYISLKYFDDGRPYFSWE